jgi:hypothetical protein
LEEDWNDAHFPFNIQIFPFAQGWDLTLLLAFVNNLPTEFKRDYFRVRNKFVLHFTFKHYINGMPIRFKIDLRTMLISVTLERHVLLFLLSAIFVDYKTNLKTRHRISPKALQLKRFRLFLFHQIIRERGTQYILSQNRNTKCIKSDFTDLAVFMAQRIDDVAAEALPLLRYFDLKVNNELQFIYKAIDTQCYSKTFDQFIEIQGGFFYITVTQYQPHDRLIHLKNQEAQHSILTGCFINKYARFILESNEIDHLVMDTTFSILPLYVTAFLFGVVRNTGIPLALCFSQKETKTIYSTFFDAFKIFCDISLAKYKLLSDQGSALKAVAKEKNMDHYFCLRHALKSLGDGLFAYEAGQLIQCKTFEDFQKLKQIFERKFQDNISDQQTMNQLNRMFKKIGLCYNDFRIEISNHTKFHQFSMIFRSIESVCTTSNCLEGYHGHLNAKVPRNNKFWSALATQINAMEVKILLFDGEVHHNILSRIRHLRFKGKMMTEEEFEIEKNYYHTNDNDQTCDCNENIIVEKLYRQKLLCHHLLRNNEEFNMAKHYCRKIVQAKASVPPFTQKQCRI